MTLPRNVPAAEHAARARAARGPWWWRARVWLADRLGSWACSIEPDDKGSMSWYSDDGELIHLATVRRAP